MICGYAGKVGYWNWRVWIWTLLLILFFGVEKGERDLGIRGIVRVKEK